VLLTSKCINSNCIIGQWNTAVICLSRYYGSHSNIIKSDQSILAPEACFQEGDVRLPFPLFLLVMYVSYWETTDSLAESRHNVVAHAAKTATSSSSMHGLNDTVRALQQVAAYYELFNLSFWCRLLLSQEDRGAR